MLQDSRSKLPWETRRAAPVAGSTRQTRPQPAAKIWPRESTATEKASVTLAIAWPPGYHPNFGDRIGFDLIVNEMRPGRRRRAGQLVWSGGNGWIWLRGDRHAAGRLGVVELVG